MVSACRGGRYGCRANVYLSGASLGSERRRGGRDGDERIGVGGDEGGGRWRRRQKEPDQQHRAVLFCLAKSRGAFRLRSADAFPFEVEDHALATFGCRLGISQPPSPLPLPLQASIASG